MRYLDFKNGVQRLTRTLTFYLTQIPQPHLNTSLRKFHRKPYTKEEKNDLRDDFSFPIIIFHFLKTFLPLSPFYVVDTCISLLVPLARVCSDAIEFNERYW